MGDTFSTGKSAAKRAKKAQDKAINEQKRKDKIRLEEEEDVMARKKALSKSGTAGRSLLTKTNPATGAKADNLGGTTEV